MRITAAITLAFAALWGSAGATWSAPKAVGLTCTGFMRDYPQALGGFRVSFERPLTITRDLFGDDTGGVELHILSTDADVDGTLRCKGDAFRRFEVRVGVPVDAKTEADFTQFQEAALAGVFHWDKARISTIVKAMSSDADEYLRASIERGDTYHAGKVEYHGGGGFDLGVIWTQADRTFIVTAQTDD